MNKIQMTIIALCAIIVSSCGSKEPPLPKEVKTIHLDVDKAEKHKDISEMFDTSFFSVIPLETKKECLIGGEIKNIFYRNDRIYVWEEQTKGVFMFDKNGKYLNKIQTPGEGPNEYINLSKVRITDDRIYLEDNYGSKILYYDLDCNYLGKISERDFYKNTFNPNYFFVLGDRMYFFNFFLDTYPEKYGSPYKACSTDMELRNPKKFLPYDIKNAPSSYFYLAEQFYASVNGNVHFMCTKYDTIYVATKDTIVPKYVLDFGDKQLPARLSKADLLEVRENMEYDKYVLGIKKLWDTKNYLILYFTYGSFPASQCTYPDDIKKDTKKMNEWSRKWPTNEYHVFIDKRTGEYSLANGINISKFGRYRTRFTFVDGNCIISYEPVHPVFFDKDGKMRGEFSCPNNLRYQRTVNEVNATLNPNSNPVITVFKLKD